MKNKLVIMHFIIALLLVGPRAYAFDAYACANQDAYDQWFRPNYNDMGNNFGSQAVQSDAVNLDLGLGNWYNAYMYDYSGVCPETFVQDLTMRPSGNPKHTWRLVPRTVGGSMNPDRCDSITLEYQVYGWPTRDSTVTWHVTEEQNYLQGEWNNRTGRCEFPYAQGSIHWKDGRWGLGKLRGVRFAATGRDGDTLIPVCLALDTDDAGIRLNNLCPISQ